MHFFFEQAYRSRQTGLEVASALNYFTTQFLVDKYFLIDLVDAAGTSTTMWIRPLMVQDWDLEWDGTQIVFCVAEDGRLLEVRIPPGDRRPTEGAGVLVGRPLENRP